MKTTVTLQPTLPKIYIKYILKSDNKPEVDRRPPPYPSTSHKGMYKQQNYRPHLNI